jgi:hypothetical protein
MNQNVIGVKKKSASILLFSYIELSSYHTHMRNPGITPTVQGISGVGINRLSQPHDFPEDISHFRKFAGYEHKENLESYEGIEGCAH